MAVAYRMVSLAARFGAVRPLLGVPVDVPGVAQGPPSVGVPGVPGVPFDVPGVAQGPPSVGVPGVAQSMLVACSA